MPLSLILIGLFVNSTPFALANPYLFTSWNLEWLTEPDVNNKHQAGKHYVNRIPTDVQALADQFHKISPDILAFQEVDSISAIQAVVGDEYSIHLSDRASLEHDHLQFDDINQYTGFAIKKGITIYDPADINLSPRSKSKLRFGSYLVVTLGNNKPVHLLSVHLKAGCSGKYQDSKACETLSSQGEAINLWLTERIKQGDSFILAGDLNHNLSYPDDWFYRIVSKNIEKDLVLTSKETTANCKIRSNKNPQKTHQFRSIIDHILVSTDLRASAAKQNLFDTNDVLKFKLSDHCPISITFE